MWWLGHKAGHQKRDIRTRTKNEHQSKTEAHGKVVYKGIPFRWTSVEGRGLSPSVWAAITKHHQRGAYKQKKFFLTVLESRSPRSRHQHGHLFWWGTSSCFIPGTLLLCPYMVEGARELCGISFIRPLFPFMMPSPSWPSHLPNTPLPIPSPLGVRI